MIISHKHKYIFIKTTKTAGTSLEIALSKYCGPDDIITPISREDEAMRQELGYRGPQNYVVPFSRYTPRDFLRAAYRRQRLQFYNHCSAAFIMRHIDCDVWNSYFKFCFERNPWDKVVSRYHWKFKTEPRPTLSEYIRTAPTLTYGGADLYRCDSEIVVDRVFQFENLPGALEEIREQIGLDEVPQLPRAKGHYRTDKRSYRDVLSDSDRETIANAFAREITQFD